METKIETRYGDTFTVGDLVSWEVVSQHERKSGIIQEFMKWDNGLFYAIIDGHKMYIEYLHLLTLEASV